MAQTSHTIRHAQTDARDYVRVTPKLKQSCNLTYQIGSSQVLLGRNIVVSQNQQQTLRPMTFKTLRYLCENSGHVVDKERIIRYAWGNRCVTDDSLVQCIAEIRRALGDKNKNISSRICAISVRPTNIETGRSASIAAIWSQAHGKNIAVIPTTLVATAPDSDSNSRPAGPGRTGEGTQQLYICTGSSYVQSR